MKFKKNFIFLIILNIVVIGCATQIESSEKNIQLNSQNTRQTQSCFGNGTVQFGASPMKIEDIGLIVPMGAMIGGHVTPIDHMYFQPAVFHSAPDTYDVYADADGIIDGIGLEPLGNENKYNKYRLTIRHTCDFYSIYNLLTSLSAEILKVTGQISPGSYYSKPIPVKRGQLLGKIGGQTLDLSVNYDKVTLKGFIVAQHYAAEPWKIHTVDPFDYFSEPIKTQLLAKNLRQAEPRGGKIDYDIDGRLVGNWFVENTKGYAGTGKDFSGYWKTHAAFAYDYIDPTHIIVSLGSYSDIALQSGAGQDNIQLQYSVKGNSPDPKDVSVSFGLVKYELVENGYVLNDTGQYWDRMSYANNIKAMSNNLVKGIVLVQLISDRKLKLEIFPDKKAADVNEFDSNAIIYER